MMYLQRILVALLACAALLGLAPAQAQTTTTPPPPPKVLVLYDQTSGTPWDKLGLGYAIMLRNLLGHFEANVDMVDVKQYTAGAVNNYDATFYLGAAYDNQVPKAFL